MTELLDLSTDVLVIGGGPAGTWAALRARQPGRTSCWSTRATAAPAAPPRLPAPASGTSPPTPARAGEGQGQPRGARRPPRRPPLDGSRARPDVREHEPARRRGRYPFPVDPTPASAAAHGLQGPEYMRRMRGVGQRRGRPDPRPHARPSNCSSTPTARCAARRATSARPVATTGSPAGAVVLATGGCAFLSRALGTNVDTGDGALMAAEVGAELSGHGVLQRLRASCPTFHRSPRPPTTATPPSSTRTAACSRAPARTKGPLGDRPNTCCTGAGVRASSTAPTTTCSARCGWASPTSSCTFDRRGIDPFTDRFEVDAARSRARCAAPAASDRGRRHCATSVPGLYAAGDAATRELICGGFTGGGSHNAAWAMSSGSWAGAGAARVRREARPSGPVRRAASPPGEPACAPPDAVGG